MSWGGSVRDLVSAEQSINGLHVMLGILFNPSRHKLIFDVKLFSEIV
jgi:hypothetical protein